MSDSTDAACATDAVRCLYLARVVERLGQRSWTEVRSVPPGRQVCTSRGVIAT